MSTHEPETPEAPPEEALPYQDGPAPLTRGRAVLETVLCSSYPTQVVAATLLAAAGVPAQTSAGALSATFVFAVSTLDALMVVALIVYFLRRRDESLPAVFLGSRPWSREAALGVALVPIVTFGVAGTVLAARTLFPSLHNVPVNPMTAFMADPLVAAAFAVMVVAAGGIREEMQRAFQLHRLSGVVCPPVVALLLTSVAFGLGHTIQGYDVAFATFGLGVLWGALYLRRGSLMAGAVSHALFNLGQVVLGWAASRMTLPGS